MCPRAFPRTAGDSVEQSETIRPLFPQGNLGESSGLKSDSVSIDQGLTVCRPYSYMIDPREIRAGT